MATVTGVTKAKMEAIEDRIIVDVKKIGTSLQFTTDGGTVMTLAGVFPAPYESTPVGGLLFTDRVDNPSTYLGGGTWVRWGNGRVPVGVDESDTTYHNFDGLNKMGGAARHRLTLDEMPSHAHGDITGYADTDHVHTGGTSYNGDHAHNYEYPATPRDTYSGGGGLGAWNSYRSTGTTSTNGGHTHTFTTNGMSANHRHSISAQGGGGEHNNLQPYFTIYIWKRTA